MSKIGIALLSLGMLVGCASSVSKDSRTHIAIGGVGFGGDDPTLIERNDAGSKPQVSIPVHSDISSEAGVLDSTTLFPALNQLLSSNNGNCDFPADLGLAVGPSCIVTVSNCEVGVFDKSGNLVGSKQQLNGFFTPAGSGGSRIFDPVAYYDPVGQEYWIIASEHGWPISTNAQFAANAYVHFAVSTNPCNDEGWTKYTSADLSILLVGVADSPGITVDADNVYLSIRDLDLIGNGFDRILVFDKSNMGSLPSVSNVFSIANYGIKRPPLPNCVPTPGTQPTELHEIARNYDSTYPQTIFMITDAACLATGPNGERRELSFAAMSTGTASFIYQTTIPLSASAYYDVVSPSVAQPGSTVALHGPTFVFFSAVFRNGFVWVAHSVDPVGGNSDSYSQWYKIDPNGWPGVSSPGPQIVDWGRIAPQATSGSTKSFVPAVAIGANESGMMTWLEGGPSDFVQIWNAKKGTASSAFVPATSTVISGTQPYSGAQNSRIWGDYISMEPDPSNECVFWAHAHIVDSANSALWRSYLIKFDMCGDSVNLWGDLNGDGSIDLFDVVQFQEAMRSADLRADLNEDGRIDLFDLTLLQERVSQSDQH